jgi:hypothetical protein
MRIESGDSRQQLHFAGSVAAAELLDHLISAERGKTHERFFVRLRQEVGEDQEVLSGLLHDLHADPGAERNTTAFLSEKLARIKLLPEDPSGAQWHDLRNWKHWPWVSMASEHFGGHFLP